MPRSPCQLDREVTVFFPVRAATRRASTASQATLSSLQSAAEIGQMGHIVCGEWIRR
jgi:hypothetical protein